MLRLSIVQQALHQPPFHVRGHQRDGDSHTRNHESRLPGETALIQAAWSVPRLSLPFRSGPRSQDAKESAFTPSGALRTPSKVGIRFARGVPKAG